MRIDLISSQHQYHVLSYMSAADFDAKYYGQITREKLKHATRNNSTN
jgi:type IV secretory pathway protease TraF